MFLFFLLFTISFVTNAQVSISGKMVDEDNNPIEFVEVLLMTADSVGIKSELADENGMFTISSETGTFIIRIQQLSQIFYSEKLDLTKDINLGIIKSSNVLALDEIVVVGKMKLVDRQIDRTVFNIENSSKSSEGDALAVLKVTPGIQVRSDVVTMIGKSDIRVMVNDKLIELSGAELSNFLKSIPSDDIKSIEVITVPPAQYDASGNSGLVNIQLRSARANSWSALIGGNYNRNSYNGGGGLANFNYNKDKLSIATSLSSNVGAFYKNQDDYAYFENSLWYTQSPYKWEHTRTSGRLDLDYQLTPNWSIGGQYLVNLATNYVTDAPYNPVYDNETNEITRYLRSESVIDQEPTLHAGNLNTAFKLDTLGRRVNVNVDYFKFSQPDLRQYGGISVIESPSSEKYFGGKNNLDRGTENYSAKIDVTYPLSWVDLTFGGKYSISRATNDISLFNSGIVDNEVVDFPLETNRFNYDEDVQAVYLSARKKFNNKWESQLGLRMEATQSSTFTENLDLTTENNYTKLFPSFYLSYNATDRSNYSLSYSRRIARPSFKQLNPNVYFTNPFQTVEGNPFLVPGFIDNVELSNNYKGLNSKVYFSYEENLFGQVAIADPNSFIINYRNENHATIKRFGLSESYTFDEIKWWTSSNSANFSYVIVQSSLEATVDERRGHNINFSSYNDFALNKDKTFMFNIGGWYNLPSVRGINKFDAMGALSAGFQVHLLDKNLRLSLKVNDIFRTEVISYSSTVNGVFLDGTYYYDSRSLYFTANYRFGNKDISAKKHRGGNQEEKRRTGN